MGAILTTHSLEVGYDGKPLLGNMTLSLHGGEMTALLGRNGAGKSTLLKVLTRAERPLGGTITVNGREIWQYTASQWARTMSVVTTERTMVGALTVTEVVSLGRQPHTGVLGRLNATDRDIVRHAIDAVGMNDLATRYFASLSDGERQKAMIARAIAQQTLIIVLDEPTAFLDVASRIETMQLLHDIARTEGVAVLLSSHDVSQSVTVADKLWVIDSARRLHDGTPDEIIGKGTMNNVFENQHIRFDRTRLDYYME